MGLYQKMNGKMAPTELGYDSGAVVKAENEDANWPKKRHNKFRRDVIFKILEDYDSSILLSFQEAEEARKNNRNERRKRKVVKEKREQERDLAIARDEYLAQRWREFQKRA